jgi:diguanylate cyclase (GGDEF)-like protein/PAS domain S-box-containing protein
MTHSSSVANAPELRQMQDAVLEMLADGVYFVDRNRRILFWNKAAEKLTGYHAEQVLGTSCADGILVHVDHQGNCLCENGCPLAAVMADGQPRQAHVFLHHADGHRVPVHVRGAAIFGNDEQIIGSVEVFSDDSDHVKTLDRLRELEQTALVDELTGLGNRRYFNRAIAASLADLARHGTPFGVLLLDIDHFKRFNDTYGHDVGDRVLQLVGRTLSHNCRAYDTPVRWGGEEFAIVSDKVTPESLRATAERMRVLVAESFLEHDGERLSVTTSVGGAAAESDDDVESIVKRADARLYASKDAGRNRVTV